VRGLATEPLRLPALHRRTTVSGVRPAGLRARSPVPPPRPACPAWRVMTAPCGPNVG